LEIAWKTRRKRKKKSATYQVSGPIGQNANQPITYGQYQQLMQALQKLDTSNKGGSFSSITHCLINSISRKAWIIDSGASDHLICDK